MLIVEKVSKAYQSGLLARQRTLAVNEVSFSVADDEIFGLVGESGCGKTTIGKMIVRLERPTSGTIRVGDTEVTSLEGRKLRAHWSRLQMIFQDPRSSLNPRMRVGESLVEGLKLAGQTQNLQQAAKDLADQVSVRAEILKRYPHEVSGGEIQRIVIARALSLNPSVLVADEPTSNLDMSVQAQVLHLLKEVQQRLRIPCVLISHDIHVVRKMCQRIAILHKGEIVETGDAQSIISQPQHPYTQALMQADIDPGHTL
ncbi:MAG: ATP-binding cassette domain-containing protein [Brachymonas sp.]|nr:ATP-binding cassette domain-containing protein [Brachymonas sp.]